VQDQQKEVIEAALAKSRGRAGTPIHYSVLENGVGSAAAQVGAPLLLTGQAECSFAAVSRAADPDSMPLLQQRQFEGFAHVPIPGVAWMQMIARVPLQRHAIRVRGILQQFVKVHHAVESAAGADPGVDRLPCLTAAGAPMTRRD